MMFSASKTRLLLKCGRNGVEMMRRQCLSSSNYIPRRAVLYVPASSEKMISKIPQLEADCVVIELEDGVSVGAKAIARENALNFLNQVDLNSLKCFDLALRVNSVASGFIEDDIKAICSASVQPQTIFVPKVESVSELKLFWHLFKENLSRKNELRRLVIYVESGKALLEMGNLLTAATQMGPSLGAQLDAVVFGSDDYCASIGAERSVEGTESLYARQKCVSIAKAFQLQAIDSVFIDLHDHQALETQCTQGSSWGFTGKQVIHPNQLETVQRCFTPSVDKLNWARSLMDEYARQENKGKGGAFVFEGQMIDAPLLLQANNISRLFDALTTRQTTT